MSFAHLAASGMLGWVSTDHVTWVLKQLQVRLVKFYQLILSVYGQPLWEMPVPFKSFD